MDNNRANMLGVSLSANLGQDSSVELPTNYKLNGLGVEPQWEARLMAALNTLPHLVSTLKKQWSYTSSHPLGLHGLFESNLSWPVDIYLLVQLN
jgi:hypothetical protein